MKVKLLLLSVLALFASVTAWADVKINEANFPDENFRSRVLRQSYGADSVLTDKEIAGVTEINVWHGGIQSLKGIEYFTALTYLNCIDNQLTVLDVSKNTELTTLICGLNQLTILDVSKNTALTELTCGRNQLTALDVSQNTALITLDCSWNQLTVLDVSQNTTLTVLNLWGNQLTTLDVSQNTALLALHCSNNYLTVLDLSHNTALTELTCGGNQLTALDLSQNPALINLDCAHNQLTMLDMSHNTALTTLYCHVNELTTLDVSQNMALTTLYCFINQLTTLDVSRNTALIDLSCYNNQIRGEGMDALIKSLPTLICGNLYVIWTEGEQNVMTTLQVDAAKAKGWIPLFFNKDLGWIEYAGSDPNGIRETSTACGAGEWYDFSGRRLDIRPTAKGIYINDGRKMVVK